MSKVSNTNKKVISNSIIYSLSGLLHKCFNFFLLPLYTSFLTTDDYGITNIASSFLNTMSFIVAMSLYSAVMRFYVDYKSDQVKLKRFYGTVVSFVFISSIITGLVLTVFQRPLSKYVFGGIQYYPMIMITLLALVFFCQHSIYDNILRSQQKAMKSSILSIMYFLSNVVLNIIFVVFLRLGATGVLLSILGTGIIYTVYFLVDMIRKRSIVFCLDIALLKQALRYSIPIMPHNLSTILVDLFSKVLIGSSNSLQLVGIYSIAAQFGSISDTLQNYVNQAYSPWLFEKLKSKDQSYKKTIRNVVSLLCSVLGLMFVGIALFSQDYIFIFLNSSYHEAWSLVPLVVFVYAIKMLYYFYVSTLFYYKKAAKKLFIATLTGSIVNVVLSSVAIPIWGAYGSIAADALAMLIRVGIVYYMSVKCEDIGLHLIDLMRRVVIVIVLVAIGLLPSYIYHITSFSMLNFCFKFLIVFTYMIMIYCQYRKEIRSTWYNLRNRKKTNT